MKGYTMHTLQLTEDQYNTITNALDFIIERREEDITYFSGDEDTEVVDDMNEEINDANALLELLCKGE
jgi:hypothetical protein